VILCNSNYEGQLNEDSQWVIADEKILADPRSFCTDLISESQPWRHDSNKLTSALIEVLDEYTGPLE